MIEQWFLDLDGVRSGPYQTPEVMSLIAEGEVLPHHRISTSLRDQRWITILDWRLDQAKISKTVPSSNFSSSRSEVSSVEGLNEETTETQIPILKKEPIAQPSFTPATPPVPVIHAVPASPKPAPTNISAPEAKPPVEKITPPAEIKIPGVSEHEESPEAFEEMRAELAAPHETKASHESHSHEYVPPKTQPPREIETPPPHDERPQAKRDPMAEMFDMLQNTKQKKEAKQNQSAATGISIEQDHGDLPKKKSGFGIGRTIAIGLGIILVGFALGQLFQQSAPPQDASAPAATPKPSPVAATSTPNPDVQIIDRSTDKMTIRGVVKKEDAPVAKPDAKNSKSGVAPAPQTERELEELRNLKKELQELKALKNNNVPDEVPDTAEGEPPTANESAADPNGNGNGNPNPNPNGAMSEPNPGTTTYPVEGAPPANNPNNDQAPGR